MSWLGFEGKTFLVTGVANRKSVAWHIARELEQEGATVVYSVRDAARLEQASTLLAGREVHLCDVESSEQIEALARSVAKRHERIDGLVHSIAYANYAEGIKEFHETPKADFLQAVDISCFSLLQLSGALKGLLAPSASVVTISISSTSMAAENYGYMAPIKAALDSSVVFLAKSFSAFSRVRFNSVRAGLLKTSASAGIPGYLDSYLYGEAATLRGEGLRTEEVANAALYLLSERSSGINAQGIVVDAGMGVNYFDRKLVTRAVGLGRGEGGSQP
jgi:enoyl-[acyl-carrier protein] reductase I